MKKTGLCLAIMAIATLGTVRPADAALVTFFTTGAFGSTGTNSTTIGTGPSKITLTFTGASETLITPSLLSFGEFVASGGNNTLVSGSDTFTLTVHQTTPGAGSGFFTGTLNGTLRVNQSGAYILFSGLAQSILGIKYTILEADNGTAGRSNLNAPKAGGANSNPATVEGKVVPEPTSIFLLGVGFLGCASIARRRLLKA